MRKILLIFFSILFITGAAQTSNKKKVLVIPFSRFEFVSEFPLEEIAEKNETTTDKVFLIYQKAILNAFDDYTDENFDFVQVENAAIAPYKKFIQYKYDKFKRKQYYATDLKEFKEEDFTKMLEYYGADFVVFLNWYDIQKESFTRGGRHEKRAPYAGHYIDYDVYNLFKQKIIGKGRVKAEAYVPDDLQVSYELLRVKELESAYSNLAKQIVDQLNNPMEQ